MTKSFLIEMGKYNKWANDIVFNWLLQITDEQWNKEIISSFNSIIKTTLHTAGAEKVWLERWQQKNDIVFLSNTFTGTKIELIDIWKNSSQHILDFIVRMEEADFNNSFSFTRLNGDSHTSLYWEAMVHVLNHSTYHRGQLVTMLRQVGFTDVSSTDMITYFRR